MQVFFFQSYQENWKWLETMTIVLKDLVRSNLWSLYPTEARNCRLCCEWSSFNNQTRNYFSSLIPENKTSIPFWKSSNILITDFFFILYIKMWPLNQPTSNCDQLKNGIPAALVKGPHCYFSLGVVFQARSTGWTLPSLPTWTSWRTIPSITSGERRRSGSHSCHRPMTAAATAPTTAAMTAKDIQR